MPKSIILQQFPRLQNDPLFKLSSKPDINYNCIAWAGLVSNEYWWPEVEPYELDGVRYRWPFNITNSEKLLYFIELFSHLGYKEISKNITNEHPNFKKIALFIKEDPNTIDILNGECTHAARQLSNGKWASKLGRFSDIEHANPYDLEGPSYGFIAIILKKNLL